ncbi:MAG: cysteine hydrolase [Alphaproteobacteria bacterium]|nr:cysteine hydrolase [Alphaproteobacteria bacterium]
MIAARPYSFPHEGELVPAATGLVVVDMQRYFLSEDGFAAAHGFDASLVKAIIPNIVSLVAAARDAGLPVFWTRHGYRPDLSDWTPFEAWRLAHSGAPGGEPDFTKRPSVRGEPGFEIIPALAPRQDELIVDKSTAGAFCSTDFDRNLRARGVSRLIFTGCTTDVCVHTTLREACDRNYQCALVEDACASGDPRAHDAAIYLTTIENGFWGVVTQTASVLDGLSRFSLQR